MTAGKLDTTASIESKNDFSTNTEMLMKDFNFMPSIVMNPISSAVKEIDLQALGIDIYDTSG